MINPNGSIFNDLPEIEVSSQYKYIFVNDFFANDLNGGAELSSEVLIQSLGNEQVFRIRSPFLTENFIFKNVDKIFIFGNFTMMNGRLLQLFINLCKYVVVEYDYKFCKLRNVERHRFEEKKECDCHTQNLGKLIEDFYLNARHILWMSEKQRDIFYNRFSSLKNVENSVLSSIFSDSTLEQLIELRNERTIEHEDRYCVLDSESWVKGKDTAINYCKNNNINFDVIGGLNPHEFLKKISKYHGIVYMPNGADTCPRMIIEAKILGLDIKTNEHVQHFQEKWFSDDNIENMVSYLKTRKDHFTNSVKEIRNKILCLTVSGYTTTHNCLKHGYPFISSIKSMSQFCDEVVVLDGGSRDGTYEALLKLSENEPKIKIYQYELDWDKESRAEFDGLQKGRARALTTSDFCWQFDVDELVTESDSLRIKAFLQNFPNKFDLMAFPVLEFWGNKGKIRTDINLWKWRLSRNKKNITHGIPGELRFYDKDGRLCSKGGSDSCDYIFSDTLKQVPFYCDFYNIFSEHILRKIHHSGHDFDISIGEKYLENLKLKYPIVYHFSWFDLERKIKFFKNYWKDFWLEMYGNKLNDIAENNVMFDKPWSEVSDEDIKIAAENFESKLSGWIWHQKWNGKETFGLNFNNINFIKNDLEDLNKTYVGDL